VGLERGPLNLMSAAEELLGGLERQAYGSGIRCADPVSPLSEIVRTNFVNKRRSLGRYSLLTD
jgi:hypothetical protein